MKFNAHYLKAALVGSIVSIVSIVILTAGVAHLIVIGQLGEGSAGLWVNAAMMIGVIAGGLLSHRFFELPVICNLISAGILIIMIVFCGLLIGGKVINMVPRIGAIIAGFVPVYIISQNRGKKRKRQNRKYR